MSLLRNLFGKNAGSEQRSEKLSTLTDEELWLLQNKMVNFGLDFKDQPVTQRDHQSVMDEMFRRKIINDRSLRLYQEGIQFAQQHDFRRAADKFREATKESPRFLTALNNLGAALLELGNPQEALEVLKEGKKICLTLDLATNIDKAEAMLAIR